MELKQLMQTADMLFHFQSSATIPPLLYTRHLGGTWAE